MDRISVWLLIAVAVGIALLANSVSAIWASRDDKFSIWLLILILISPLVFITFGLLTARVGVAVGAGTIDALLTVATVLVGLFFFHEWGKVTTMQYLGLFAVFIGIILMHISGKVGT